MVIKTRKTVNYKVKITTTTVSKGLDKVTASKVAKAARAEIAQREVKGAKVAIVRA